MRDLPKICVTVAELLEHWRVKVRALEALRSGASDTRRVEALVAGTVEALERLHAIERGEAPAPARWLC